MTKEKKYIITKETIEYEGMTLHRIKAIRDFGNIKSGDLGGFIEEENNLSHNGNCWIFDNAKVFENAEIRGNAIIADNAVICQYASIGNYAQVSGNAKIYHAAVTGHAKICDNIHIGMKNSIDNYYPRIFGNVELKGKLHIHGDVKIY